MSGTIVQEPHISPSDLPFLDPFGNDFEFHVAPDSPYFDLLAGTGDGAYQASTKEARDTYCLSVSNVIGMEWDSSMVPTGHRPKLRPPTPRNDLRDRLWVRYQFTRRDDSCAVAVLRGTDNESVRVVIVLNDAGYVPPRGRRNTSGATAEIANMGPDNGKLILVAVFANAAPYPLAGSALAQGIESHTFRRLAAPNLHAEQAFALRELRGTPDMPPDTSQPYPIVGKITLEWERHGVVAPPGPPQRRG